MKQRIRNVLKTILKEWVLPVVVVVAVLGSFRSAVADWMHVPTGSMLPTIVEGDRIFVNKMAYDLCIPFTDLRISKMGDPAAGEVAVFRSPESGIRLVKRIIGTPGDVIEMRNNRLTVNGTPVEYEPHPTSAHLAKAVSDDPSRYHFSVETIGEEAHPVMLSRYASPAASFGPLTVPAGQYFTLGDNRDGSRDSRYFGFVDRDAFMGRVSGVVYSLDPSRFWIPRWDRTCSGF